MTNLAVGIPVSFLKDRPLKSELTPRCSVSYRVWAVFWNGYSRLLAFALAFTSIACLILHFYGLASMRFVFAAVTIPAFVILAALCWRSVRQVDKTFAKMVAIGSIAGLVAAIAYDLFRLPFVVLHASGYHYPFALPLFKVFPAFGALLLGQPALQANYSVSEYALGWTYHFSNAVGFGIMYVAAIGYPLRRHWIWAVVMAVGLETGMLLMPYADLFSIRITPWFISMTSLAHGLFGLALGLSSRWLANRLDSRFYF